MTDTRIAIAWALALAAHDRMTALRTRDPVQAAYLRARADRRRADALWLEERS